MSIYKARINEFRQVLKKQKLDAFIIPQADIWQSEHVDECDQRLKYICGLDTSAGFVVVTQERAVVLIDTRYSLKAENTVDHDVFEIDYYHEISPIDWAIKNLEPRQVVGYDLWLHTKSQAKDMVKKCTEANIFLESVHHNPVDMIWDDQPRPTPQNAIHLGIEFSGQHASNKLGEICDDMRTHNTDSIIITAPDSIAWALNLRTIENTTTPGIKGFMVIERERQSVTVFTDVCCADFDHTNIAPFKIDFIPLIELEMVINHFEQKEQIIQISNTAPDWFTEHMNSPASVVIERDDPCQALKAIKNIVEQDGIRACHLRDGQAMIRAINQIKTQSGLTEKDIDKIILNERQNEDLFRGVSFDSIVGWNANGAAIHGSPSDTMIEGDGLLLIDSGGQYDDGTTDITRTIPIGCPSEDMKHHYTLVLKAHIALATAIFPQGTTGIQLDAITRAPLWAAGLDYAHGTGHGVGHFLNVHEGPCGISPRSNSILKEGMLISNEPGYYRKDHYGIRLENLMLVQKYKDIDEDGNKTGKVLLCFETVTKVPFEESCILFDMLSEDEREWVSKYHEYLEDADS